MHRCAARLSLLKPIPWILSEHERNARDTVNCIIHAFSYIRQRHHQVSSRRVSIVVPRMSTQHITSKSIAHYIQPGGVFFAGNPEIYPQIADLTSMADVFLLLFLQLVDYLVLGVYA